MNSHLHVSLNYALRVITHHVTHPMHGPLGGVGIMLLRCYTDEGWRLRTGVYNLVGLDFFQG